MNLAVATFFEPEDATQTSQPKVQAALNVLNQFPRIPVNTLGWLGNACGSMQEGSGKRLRLCCWRARASLMLLQSPLPEAETNQWGAQQKSNPTLCRHPTLENGIVFRYRSCEPPRPAIWSNVSLSISSATETFFQTVLTECALTAMWGGVSLPS